jgi:hypothetical protein
MTDDDHLIEPEDDGEDIDHEATAAELSKMMASQAGTVRQSDIPAGFDVFATMEAAWRDFAEEFLHRMDGTIPPSAYEKIMDDAKFTFYSGIRAAANLCIYCDGQGKFEAAADQITAECVAYDAEEARKVQAKRAAFDAGPDDPGPAPINGTTVTN